MAFVPLHNHSDYSLLDGASQLPAMVERAKALGMPAIALTDHGVMYGAIELLKLCQDRISSRSSAMRYDSDQRINR